MKKLLCTTVLMAAAFFAPAQSVTRLLACSPFDDQLVVFDTSSYTALLSKTLTSSFSVDGINGLAKKPSTGVYYTVVKNSGSRYLGTLNPVTGVITVIGPLNDNFSQITFNGNSTLLGVTGSGASVPNTVYRINTANASTSLLQTVNSGYGQIICYNPVDNRVYHWANSGPYAYNSYDTSFVASVSITPGVSSSEVVGAVYKTGNIFVHNDWNNDFRKVRSTGGSSVSSNYSAQVFKGLAYITCSRSISATSSSVCAGNSVTLTMSGVPGATYQWYRNNTLISSATSAAFSATVAGYYKCRISDGCGVDSLAAGINLGAAALPTVAITGPTASVCNGQTLQLLGTSGGTSQWYKNGSLIPGATTNSLVISTSGVYNMIKTNTNGCKDSAATGKTVNMLPSPTVTVAGASSLCAGQTGTLSASGGTIYIWNHGSPSASGISITPTATSVYTVTGFSPAGCKDSTYYTVTVRNNPTVSISPTSHTICLKESAVLTGSGAVSYTWSNGSTSPAITVTPAATTVYSVNGLDAFGCSGTASVTQVVSPCDGITAYQKGSAVFEVYPNPADNQLHISGQTTIEYVELLDISGRQLIREAVGNATSYTLDISTLKPSVYFVRVAGRDGSKSQLRIVVNR